MTLSNPLDKLRVNQLSNDKVPVPKIAYHTDLQLAYLSLPKELESKGQSNVLVDKIVKMIDEVEVGDKIVMKCLEKNTKADVIENLL